MPSSRPVRWLRLLSRGRQTLDLPGLLSASEFERLFQREKALADRQARTFSLVVIDPRGDEEQIGRLCDVLRDRLRGGDAIGRLDSERLAVLLAGTDAKGAWTYADDLLRRLAEAQVSADCRVYADLPYQFQGQGKPQNGAHSGGGFQGNTLPSSLSGASARPLPPSGASPLGQTPVAQAGTGGEGAREPHHPGQKRLEFPDSGDGSPGEAPGLWATGSNPSEAGSTTEPSAPEQSEDTQGQGPPLRIQDHPLHRLESTGAGAPIADGNTLRRLEREPAALAGNLVAFPERLSDMAAIRRDLGDRPVYNLEEVLVAPTPFWKRAMDILGSGLALICLAPVLGLLAVLVRLSSPGPIIFRQQRIGAGGRPFTFYKFRSMYMDAEARKAELMAQNEADGPVFKMKNDPRVTPIGRILRRYSLDELPQLWNVFRGDMSLVGPRPPTPNEVPGYQAWQRQRLRLKGGLTCTWQVSGRSDVSFEEWMRMDARYAKQRGLRTDLKLILETIKAIFTGRGAY